MILNAPSARFLLLALATPALAWGCSKPAEPGAKPEAHNAAPAPTGKKIDYAKDVQPILSNYCYHCHGPDTNTRVPKGKPLRLDIRDQALAYVGPEGKRAIVPGKPDQSELVRRVESHDPDEMMPQDKEKLLNPAQIKLLRDWIAQGAEFRDHWAFEKPVKAALPKVSDEAWCKTPIDRFVLAQLDEEGLKPNPEADRRSLIRRVTLDLVGLNPTPAEIEAFLADPDPTDKAYEKVVDRLLADPKYGEQRGRHWLDYARYADTHGVHVDPYRSIWPYRDYVLKALNDDKPFDRFVTEQLAGDLLPDATAETLVASAFVRAGVSTGEGGTIVEENWNNLIRERTEAFGAVFMGMTTACAVCHDHKYDPTSARDFYSLAAYFGNLREKSWTGDHHNWAPNITLPKPEDKAAFDAAVARRAKAEADLRALRETEAPAIAAWLKTSLKPVDQGLVAWFPLDEGKGKEVREAVSGKSCATDNAPPIWDDYPHATGSFRLADNTRLKIADAGDFEKDQPFTISGWFRPYEVVSHDNYGFGNNTGTLLSRMDGKNLRGWDFYDENNRFTFHLVGDKYPDGAIKVAGAALPRPEWTHVAVTYDGSGKAAGVKIYQNGKPVPMQVGADNLTGSTRTPTPLNFGRRGGDDNGAVPARQTGFQDVRIYSRVLSAQEVTSLPKENALAQILRKKPDYLAVADEKATLKTQADPWEKAWTPFEKRAAQDAYFTRFPEKTKALEETIAKATTDIQKLGAKGGSPGIGNVRNALQAQYDGKAGALTLVSRENDGPAFSHLLGRGEYASLGERLYPDTPAFLPPQPKDAPRDRLGLARWTLSPENPLTARVAINRLWQEFFGIGIVESPEDFGIVGARPTHPELLDWLAVDFRDNAEKPWGMKRMAKQMVMSAAYRQSAAISKEKLEKDPKNALYARGPRHRLDAEQIRDTALQAGGILNTAKVGGPSFLSYMPAGVLGTVYPSNTTTADQHHGPMLYRRSMYRLIKRMVPTPEMEVFDGCDRLAATVKRNRTNTPLAALTLMNDVTFLEAARVLAQKTLEEGGATDAEKYDYIAMRLLCRPLAEEERKALAQVKEAFAKETTPASAKTMLAIGEWPQDAKLDPVQQAVWMGVASTLMNSDEAISK